MNKSRLEAFSDGVIAIIITIMVLELRAPESGNLASLIQVLNTFLSYVLSFIYLAIYWNNHHHMITTLKQVDGRILWANLHLLFWLSLVPFGTAWMGKNYFASDTLALYGFILLMAAIAYHILQLQILHREGKNSLLAKAVGRDLKGKISPILYVIAILSTLLNGWIAGILYVTVALIWLIPDKRIERISRGEIK